MFANVVPDVFSGAFNAFEGIAFVCFVWEVLEKTKIWTFVTFWYGFPKTSLRGLVSFFFLTINQIILKNNYKQWVFKSINKYISFIAPFSSKDQRAILAIVFQFNLKTKQGKLRNVSSAFWFSLAPNDPRGDYDVMSDGICGSRLIYSITGNTATCFFIMFLANELG